MVRIDSWNTESSAAISLKLKWRFSVTISFTLAMLTSVEDIDGRPHRGKSSTTSPPLFNALYHSYARVDALICNAKFETNSSFGILINWKNRETHLRQTENIEHCEQNKWWVAPELHVRIEDSRVNSASKRFLTTSSSGLFEWSIPDTFLTECKLCNDLKLSYHFSQLFSKVQNNG